MGPGTGATGCDRSAFGGALPSARKYPPAPDPLPGALPACAGGCVPRRSSSISAAWRSMTDRASLASASSLARSRSLSARSDRASWRSSRICVSMPPSLASERRVQTFSAASGPAISASMPPAGPRSLPPPMPSQTATATSSTAAIAENSSS